MPKRIYWHQQPTQILDDSKLPFAKWFVGGKPICVGDNMVDRHLENRAEQKMPLCGCLPKSMLKWLIITPIFRKAFKALGNPVELYTDYANAV